MTRRHMVTDGLSAAAASGFEVERMFVGEFAGSFLFLQKNFSQRKRRENEPVIDLARCRRCCRRWRANQRQP